MPSNHLILCRPLLLPLSIFPIIRIFSNESVLCIQVAKSIGVSTSTSVLPMDIQDWYPLGLTGWISLQFKGLSRVFSNTIVQKHQFFGVQFSSVQSLSRVLLFATPWNAACQASLSITNSWSLLRFMSIKQVMHPTISSSVLPFSSISSAAFEKILSVTFDCLYY